jgi:hypothetical protein
MKIMKRKVKTLLLYCFFAGFCAICNAQDYYGNGNNGSWRRKPNNDQQPPKDENITEPSGYLSINFGFATPEGSYGQSFSESAYPLTGTGGVGIGYGGYAQPGFAFDFSLGVPINHSNFGIAFMFGSYNNEYDLNSYVNSLSASSINYNVYSASAITGYSTAPSANDYSESSILGGLFFTYPIGRLSLDGRAMLGVLLSGLPEQDIYAIDAANDELQYDVESSNSTSLAFDVGIGARFMIAQFGRRKLCVMVNLDYLYSNVSYSTQQDLYVVPASGANAGYQVSLIPTPAVSGSFPIQMLNVTFGIGYQL